MLPQCTLKFSRYIFFERAYKKALHALPWCVGALANCGVLDRMAGVWRCDLDVWLLSVGNDPNLQETPHITPAREGWRVLHNFDSADGWPCNQWVLWNTVLYCIAIYGFRIQDSRFLYLQHNMIRKKPIHDNKNYSWCSNHLLNGQINCAKNTTLSHSYRNDRTINLIHINRNIRNFTVHSLQCEQTKETIMGARMIYCQYTEAWARN